MDTSSTPPMAFRRHIDMPAGLPADQDAEAAFIAWLAGAAENTITAVLCDMKTFREYCQQTHCSHLPASVRTVLGFIDVLVDRKRSLATIKRALASISTVHRLAGLPSPTETEAVRWRKIGLRKTLGSKQRQASGLRLSASSPLGIGLEDILAIPPVTLRDYRDQALLSLAYDAGLRRSEIIGVQVYDLLLDDPDGPVLFVPKSKNSREGAFAAVTAESVALITRYRDQLGLPRPAAAEIEQRAHCPLFAIIDCQDRYTGRSLHDVAVDKTYKRWARRAARHKGMNDEQIANVVRGFSTHSTRVGNAQDRLYDGVSMAAIAQALRWRSLDMVARYTAKVAVHATDATRTLLRRRAQPEG